MEEAAFLAAIAASPDDDTLRLVLADWLDEHNRPDEAELIRVQIELEPIRNRQSEPRTDEFWHREHSLTWSLQQDEQERLKSLFGECARDIRVVYRRGLVDSLTLPVQWFIEHGGTLRQWYPTLRKFSLFRINGWGERLAACPHLRGLPELDLPCWYSHDDCAAIAHSPHLSELEVLNYWRGGSQDADSNEQLCTFADSGAWPNLRKLSVMLGDADDEALVNAAANRTIAEVIDPNLWLFPFPADFGADRFFVGRITEAAQFFAIDALNDEGMTRGVLFDASGNEIEQRDIQFPQDTLFPNQSQFGNWDERYKAEDEYRARRERYLHENFGFVPGFIRVKQFWIGDVGPERYRGRVEEFIGYVDDPNISPETDREGVLGVGGEVYEWITRKQFVFNYGNDWWCDERGYVTST